MVQSLKRLKDLDGDYQVVPGHGPLTTLEHERRYNPFMRRL
jgi:glyoxylase-like metal-dependent hydrolase (beta-lactamase superfamily II)